VVVGSGGGFAPVCVRQAQVDAGMAKLSRTLVVDANRGPFGRPDYLNDASEHLLRREFGDVEVVVEDAVVAADTLFQKKNAVVDLVILDADHSHAGSLAAARAWLPKLSRAGVLVLNTGGAWGLGSAKTPAVLRRDFDVVSFPGFALVKPKNTAVSTIDVNAGVGGLGELYVELHDDDDVSAIAASLCALRGWGSLPTALNNFTTTAVSAAESCSDALLAHVVPTIIAPSPPSQEEDDVASSHKKNASIAALLERRARIDDDLRALGYPI